MTVSDPHPEPPQAPLVVTGASGQLGRRVVDLLLDHHGVTASAVRALTRRPEALADLSRRGVDVRRASFDEPDTLTTGFAGASRVLVVSGDDLTPGTRERQHAAAVAAAVAADVGHVVYTSVQGAEPGNPAAVAPTHRATEEALRSSGLPWTSLRNGLYAEQLAATAQQAVAMGSWVHNAADGATAYVAREDCAAVAAAVLAGEVRAGAGDAGQVLDVTGGEAWTQAEAAAVVAGIVGADLPVVALDDEAFIAGLQHAGVPPAVAAMIATFGRSQRAGWWAPVSPTVARLTGRPATSVRDVLAAGLHHS